MDKETFNSEQSDFISALEKELSGVKIPEEKVREIKRILENDNGNFQSYDAIVDILVSIIEIADPKQTLVNT